MGLWQEFKAFAVRGNVIDVAVGIAVGAAFSRIATSLVNDILMPPIGMILGKVDFADLRITLREGVAATADSPAIDPVTVNYGSFINVVIHFIIIAFAIFLVVKGMNRLQRLAESEQQEQAEAAEAPPPPKDIQLLTEIRDALVKR